MACQTSDSKTSSQDSTNMSTDLSRWTQNVCTREVKPKIVFCFRMLKPVSLVGLDKQ